MLLAEAWIWKSQGCLNGALCLRCHLCPAGEIKRRKKDGRQRYMGLLQSCNARQEQLKRLTVGTVGRCEDEETGSTHLQITPLLAATSLPPVPPPTSSPMVDFLDDALPPAPTWDTKDAEPLQPLVPPLAQPLAQPLASVVELPELAEPIWRPPPGLELEMPLPPCPPPMMPPSLPSLGSVLHGSGECQPCLDFWSTEGCPRGHDCSQCHLCSAELKVQHQARMAGIVLQPISRALEFEEPIDEPSELSEPNASAQPKFLDPIPGPSFEQRTRFPSDQSLKQRLDRVLDEPEDVPCERGTKPPSTSTLRLPALHGCVICGSRGVALERLPSQDLETIQADGLADLPSLGSVLHAKGCCSPCAWVWKPQGCHNGSNCGRCHLCPPGEVKLRKKAKARESSPDPNCCNVSCGESAQKLVQAREARSAAKAGQKSRVSRIREQGFSYQRGTTFGTIGLLQGRCELNTSSVTGEPTFPR
ncbi:GekBS024P [Symbiodinium pilosum]|uniref:GekBS024P protein n=1 Tax=Symbiodinium pilosum TaxID=2952 RepID=A0A812VVM5_SYMPI|nr:GekBS024P [Symbiodinium pilosum]